MGTGASIEGENTTVATNSRVAYSLQQENLNVAAAAGKKVPAIDTPVLMDLGHGTIRYRYIRQKHEDTADEMQNESGDDKLQLGKKGGYFYHARLHSFKSPPLLDGESDYKFKYVMRGPARDQSKRIYYVYGRGLGTKENNRLPPRSHPAKPPQREKVWTQGFRLPNHEYFLVQLHKEGSSPLDSEDEEQSLMEDAPDPALPFSVPVPGDHSVAELLTTLSLRTLKAPDKVHLGLIGAECELKSEANLWQSLCPEKDAPASYSVLVTRVGTL